MLETKRTFKGASVWTEYLLIHQQIIGRAALVKLLDLHLKRTDQIRFSHRETLEWIPFDILLKYIQPMKA